MSDRTLEQLWDRASAPGAPFDPAAHASLPDVARRYLGHAVAPGVPLACAVRLRMHGEIKLAGWAPFEAEQVIDVEHGFVWRAKVRMKGLPVRGSDRWVDGVGAMDWRLFGIVPVARASGPDVSRSAAGRAHAESIWIPSRFARAEWRAGEDGRGHASLTTRGESTPIELAIDARGRPTELRFARWGDPDRTGRSAQHAFGGLLEEERTFGGYTIPSRVRVGWHFGTARWDEGEFFRATIDDATFR